jgi:hypothetical protein
MKKGGISVADRKKAKQTAGAAKGEDVEAGAEDDELSDAPADGDEVVGGDEDEYKP